MSRNICIRREITEAATMAPGGVAETEICCSSVSAGTGTTLTGVIVVLRYNKQAYSTVCFLAGEFSENDVKTQQFA